MYLIRLRLIPEPRVGGKKMEKTILSLYLCLMILSGCNPFVILGPSDKPDIKAIPWSSLELTYWIKVSETEKKKRKITITDRFLLQELSSKLSVKEIRGISIPYGGQFVLKMQNGMVWDGIIVFENRIGICKASDNYYSYTVELNDYAFWKMLNQICLSHERETSSHATERNIILRQNLSLSAYDTLQETEKENP